MKAKYEKNMLKTHFREYQSI